MIQRATDCMESCRKAEAKPEVNLENRNWIQILAGISPVTRMRSKNVSKNETRLKLIEGSSGFGKNSLNNFCNALQSSLYLVVERKEKGRLCVAIPVACGMEMGEASEAEVQTPNIE